MRRRFTLFLAPLVLAVASACSSDTLDINSPKVPHVDTPSRATVIVSPAGALGECQANVPVTPDGTGALTETSTGCSIPDSTLVSIRVQGTLVSTVNPDAIWCVPGSSAPAVGTYGPMGGGGSNDWMSLLVSVRGYSATAGTFSMTPRDTTMTTVLTPGAAHTVVAYSDGFFLGKGMTDIRVLRSGNLRSVSCTGPASPYPPGCASGTTRTCGPFNSYRVNGVQTLFVNRAAATLRVEFTTKPAYEGDTLTFTASSSDARPVDVRQWIWQDSTGAAVATPCAAHALQCRFAPAGSGRMIVRGRVGTNPYIEQAVSDVTMQPLQLVLTVSPSAAYLLDTVTVTGTSVPSRIVTQLQILPEIVALRGPRARAALSGDSAAILWQVACGTPAAHQCVGVALAGGTLRATALVNGRPKIATVALAVSPFEVDAVLDSGSTDDGTTDAAGTYQPRSCATTASNLELPLVSDLNIGVQKLIGLGTRRNFGPGLITLQQPFRYLRTVQNNVRNFISYPRAFYQPFYGSFTPANDLGIPGGIVFIYDKSRPGVQFYCDSWLTGGVWYGKLEYADKYDMRFLAVYNRP